MKKAFYIFVLIFALCVTNAFAKTADFSWKTGNNGEKTWLGTRKSGVSALGIGLITGYPATSIALRYRSPDNHIRLMANFGYDYAPSLAIPGKASPALDYSLGFEYVVYSLSVGGSKDENKLWCLDFAPFLSLGLYIPLDDPRRPIDYNSFFAQVGLNVSLDLPYSNIPLGLFMRAYYVPTIPLVRNHFLYKNRFGIDVGVVWHIKFSGGETVTNSSKKSSGKSIFDIFKSSNEQKTTKGNSNKKSNSSKKSSGKSKSKR